jgi:hypothetical protein
MVVAGGIALVFAVATYPSPGDGRGLQVAALRLGAERLLSLQREDGTWPRDVEGAGDAAAVGRPALALLRAHDVVADPRHLAAVDRAAEALVSALPRSPRVATTPNLLFLAELADRRGDDRLRALAREAWVRKAGPEALADPALAARELMARPNPTVWLDGAWRNYLLWTAGDTAELARVLGEVEWSNTFTLTVAETWAPKHDYQWWSLGAGRMLDVLSAVPGERARRLSAVQLAAIANNETLPGLPWSDTPYDTYVYTREAAAALKGLASSHDEQAFERARLGLRLLARRQASHGGWGAAVSLLAHPLPAGHPDATPAAEDAIDESPDQDADVVLALAASLGARRSEALAPVPRT